MLSGTILKIAFILLLILDNALSLSSRIFIILEQFKSISCRLLCIKLLVLFSNAGGVEEEGSCGCVNRFLRSSVQDNVA